jgi:hypothetical protein
MEAAVLRPTRRPARPLLALSAALLSLGLIWPAGIAAAPSAEQAPSPADSARADRAPVIHGEGVRDFDSGRGSRPAEPLEELGPDTVGRGSIDVQAAPGDTTGGTPPAPVVASGSGAPAAESFGAWEGLDEDDSGFEPPDPWLAVGPDDVVQTVNTKIRFTNREGVSTAADLDVFEFFELDSVEACPPPANPGCTPVPTTISGVGNPRWHYDVTHNRWIGMAVGWHCTNGSNPGPSGFIFGAISTTADPTDEYYHFYVQYPDYLPDYANLGISADKLTFTANESVLGGGADCASGAAFDAASTTTFDWSQLLAFPAAPPFTYDFSFDHFALRAAVAPKATSNTIFVVGERIVDADTSNVSFMRITGTNAAGGTTTPLADAGDIDLTTAGIVAPFEEPPLVQQPGTELPDDAVDRRPTDAIWQDNVLTFASTYPCSGRACGRVTQLNTGPATPTLRQDMLAASTNEDVFYPGIGQSQSGTLHVVYTESSAGQGHTSVDRYQLPSDAINTLSAARVIASGGAVSYTGQAWGRVVGVAQDPRDTNAVWQGNQYTNGSGEWATRVSELQTAGSTFVPIDPVRLLDSRSNNGTTGPFAHGVPKTIDIAGRLTVPDEAVAITGNLTVVNQTAAGYAALTQVPIVNPATSTINFPLGDTRANNVTAPLSGTGGVSITYRASAGRTTHFILDVTGYFINEDVAASHTYTDMAPARVLDSRPAFQIGLSGVFQANVNRQFDVAGQGGVPANAKAITGNLTVVNQTRAGYVSLATEAPPTIPATSTLNFPAGDTRANGVTIKLNASGGLWAVYKAPPGASTHLILDVTGYYLQDLNGARFVAITPGRRMDSRFAAAQESLTGPFAANVARTLIIEPYQGVPGNATAITGNLTVVGQQRAGYVAMTATATNAPTTSTINFPVGDIRANGVTGPLHPTNGSVGLVYEASGGLTHLILDVTGYFR